MCAFSRSSAAASHGVLSLRRNGSTVLYVMPRDDHGNFLPGADVQFDEPLYTVDSPGGTEYVTPTIRINYGSFVPPPTRSTDYELTTGKLILLGTIPVLDEPTFGPYNPTRYVQERAWATAADGVRVPLSIVRRSDVALDGQAPASCTAMVSLRSRWILCSGLTVVAAGSGRDLCHCPYPRRRRTGAQLVRSGSFWRSRTRSLTSWPVPIT